MPKNPPVPPNQSPASVTPEGLYDLDQGGKFQDPDKLFSPYIETYQRNLHFRRYQRTLKTMLEGAESQFTDGWWTRTAKVVGFQSMEPAKYKDALWAATVEAFGSDTKICNMAMGALLKWTIAQYALDKGIVIVCYKTADDQMRTDPLTGKVIEWTAYMLDNGKFTPPVTKGKKANGGKLSLSGLQDAWGAKVI